MRVKILSTLFFLCFGISQSQDLAYDRNVDWNLPDAVAKAFRAEGLLKKFRLSDTVNPFYLRGDFDGDGKPDYAILLESRESKHREIAVVLSRAPKVAIVGAGGFRVRVEAGKDSYFFDDFDWMDAWQVEAKQHLDKSEFNPKVPAQMQGEGILAEKTEAAGGIIYWDGKQFRWYQTSD